MAKVDPTKDPMTTSGNYAAMVAKWAMIDALLGGTEAMRAAGEVYLPRHAREGDLNYEERLMKAVLFNMFELTVNLLADKPFTEQISFSESMPATLVEYAEDVDLRGSNLTRFGYEVFRTGLAKGFTHILVDAPSSDVPEGQRTLADDREEGMRPYMVHIKPENVIFAETMRIKGEEVFTHIRFKHYETTRVGYAEVTKMYIRVMDLLLDDEDEYFVRSTWLEKVEEGKNKGEWVSAEGKGGVIEIDRIPLVSFYTDRDDILLSKPPLLDLAFLNVEHFQSYSDQQNILTVTRFPLLASSGISEYDGNDTVVGPRNMLVAEDPTARFYYVEHTGAAIMSGEKALGDLENKMASYGGSLLQRRPDRETAAARDAAESTVTSPLQRMVQTFRDVLAVAFQIMQKLDGEEGDDPKALAEMINIRDDFGDESATAVDLQTLQVAVREGAISRRGFLQSLKRMKILADDFDIDAELTDIESELPLIAMLAAARKGMSDVQDPANISPDDGEAAQSDGPRPTDDGRPDRGTGNDPGETGEEG